MTEAFHAASEFDNQHNWPSVQSVLELFQGIVPDGGVSQLPLLKNMDKNIIKRKRDWKGEAQETKTRSYICSSP